MHLLQRKLLDQIKKHAIKDMSLTEIGTLVKEKHPQGVKHHLGQLAKNGIIKIEKRGARIYRVYLVREHAQDFIPLPIVGSANCGEALQFADEHVEGYLMVSKSFLPKKVKDAYVLRAVGESMNRAKISGNHIEDGDSVIVDGSDHNPAPNSYVVSVIDGMANIKKFTQQDDGTIALIAESTESFPPIYIHPNDLKDYMISGRVIRVIKQQKR